MGRPFLSSIPHTSRSFYHLRYRIAVLLLVFTLFQQQHLFLINRNSLSAKYSPTEFTSHSHELHTRFIRPDDEDSHLEQDLLANRDSWKVLGKGWEGKVFAYKDSVIKTFTPGQSPFRNCAPYAAGERWPTEIPASLYFGGISKQTDIETSNQPPNASTVLEGFLPVRTYFKNSVKPTEPAEWYLVTPFLTRGNLNSFARELSGNKASMSFQEIDSRYRPIFNALLKSLGSLHQAGYCHDDIKPTNIFIKDESHWVLGDLGNLRHMSHPYHLSRLWKENQQLEDCRANDVVRALKSYIKFVQSSASDADQFNVAFYEVNEPISRLFWWTVASARTISATALHERSLIEYPEAPRRENDDMMIPQPAHPRTIMSFFSRRLALKRAVDHALTTRMGEKLARWWAMTWLFGVPVSDICGV